MNAVFTPQMKQDVISAVIKKGESFWGSAAIRQGRRSSSQKPEASDPPLAAEIWLVSGNKESISAGKHRRQSSSRAGSRL